MISFIVPAHNEELWIGKCLGSIRTTMATLAEPFEVIVVDDASTDSTPRIAEQMGARTIRVEHRKISAKKKGSVPIIDTFARSSGCSRDSLIPFSAGRRFVARALWEG